MRLTGGWDAGHTSRAEVIIYIHLQQIFSTLIQVSEAVARIDANPRLRVGRGNNPDEVFVAPRGAIAYNLVTNWLKRKA